jgi:hypothetical protein
VLAPPGAFHTLPSLSFISRCGTHLSAVGNEFHDGSRRLPIEQASVFLLTWPHRALTAPALIYSNFFPSAAADEGDEGRMLSSAWLIGAPPVEASPGWALLVEASPACSPLPAQVLLWVRVAWVPIEKLNFDAWTPPMLH